MKSEKSLCKIVSLSLLVVTLSVCPSCGKENTATTMNLMKMEGAVCVEDAKGKSLEPVENMGLYSGYGIGTRTESYAWINLDDVKLTKMDQDSQVAIGKDGGKLEIDVQSGSLFFNITEALDEDEAINIRTSTMLVGIRGTSGWVVNDGEQSSVALLHGKVEAVLSTDGGEEDITIGAMEVLNVRQEGDNISYEIQALEDIPDFVDEEIARTPVTLFEVMGVMEEHEVTEEEFWYCKKDVCREILGKDSLNVLVPYVPGGWNGRNGYIGGGIPTDYTPINLSIGVSVDTNLMHVPAGEPEVHGDYLVWVDHGEEDTLRVREQTICIARASSRPDDFGRYYAVRFILSTRQIHKEDYRIPGRPVSEEVIQGLFEAEYEMILNQLR